MSVEKIASVTVEQLLLPLKVPYKLSFGPVTAFDTVLVRVRGDAGSNGVGEATILTGYTPETIDGCWNVLMRVAQQTIGQDFDSAQEIAFVDHAEAPFSVTGINTAIEMAAGSSVLSEAAGQHVPLLAILSATTKENIEQEIRRHAADGYTTIKVKVGWDVDDDLHRIAFIQSALPDGVSIRIDGNQGFSKSDGVRFASSLNPAKIELLEQPCHMDDWDAAAATAKVCTVPYMLDESIYGEREIERAAEMDGVAYIKLKLMKAGSLEKLATQLTMIRDCGMRPVLGNGVASDIGCWMEACVARSHIDNAGEMNGFLKPVTPLFAAPMVVERGAVSLPTGMPSLIDTSPWTQRTFTAGTP